MFIFEREGDRTWAGEGQRERERETQNLKQAPSSELSAQNPVWGSNSWTARSWPEPKLDVWATQMPRDFSFFNVGVYSYRFPFQHCFLYIPYLLASCIFIFIHRKILVICFVISSLSPWLSALFNIHLWIFEICLCYWIHFHSIVVSKDTSHVFNLLKCTEICFGS